MTPNHRQLQTWTVRALGGRVVSGRWPNSSALPSAPLGVSPASRRPCQTTLTFALLLKRRWLGHKWTLESP